ncbi:hypothetical protein [Streptacidiphilus sp. EB103A]|uniref:hypothetical protein n=1 Tax=Streptacidiphilus sp. EB103A TaxID=3156275 RepID=UPI0035139313
MSYTPRELRTTYEPGKEYLHFVLAYEPRIGAVGSAMNADVTIERPGPCTREWAGGLVRCDPNALHTTLVDPRRIPDLFHPCVDDDKDSPAAVAGSGCGCFRTWYDPHFGLPVVAEHYRTADGGRTDRWTYSTYAPLELRAGDTFASLVLNDGGNFWIRTADGVLTLLPQEHQGGYGTGYGGTGPGRLARYITGLLASDGRQTNAGGYQADADPRIAAWVASRAADARQELTLRDLQRIAQD